MPKEPKLRSIAGTGRQIINCNSFLSNDDSTSTAAADVSLELPVRTRQCIGYSIQASNDTCSFLDHLEEDENGEANDYSLCNGKKGRDGDGDRGSDDKHHSTHNDEEDDVNANVSLGNDDECVGDDGDDDDIDIDADYKLEQNQNNT